MYKHIYRNIIIIIIIIIIINCNWVVTRWQWLFCMHTKCEKLGILGTISAFAYRHRETKKNLCRGGRSQDLPNTDF